MKKTIKLVLAIAAVMTFTQTSFAQTEKGGWLVGASSNLGFSTGKQDKDQKDAASTLNVSPQVGYFVMDNLAVGLSLDFASYKQGDYKNSSFGVGPFARYYFPMKIFAQLGYNFGSEKTDDGSGSGDFTAKTGDLNIGVGYAWMLNDNVSIEPSLQYDMTTNDNGGSPAEKSTGSSFGVNVGFALYFGGK